MKTFSLLAVLLSCNGASPAKEELVTRFGRSDVVVVEDAKRGVVCYTMPEGISCLKLEAK
jgi:hypothetical protein